MACITLLAPPLAMATTQLVRALRYENVSASVSEGNEKRNSLHMSWVVVTDSNGHCKLQIHWSSAEDD
jgi:hypothetical protein